MTMMLMLIVKMLSAAIKPINYAGCHSAECHKAECRGAETRAGSNFYIVQDPIQVAPDLRIDPGDTLCTTEPRSETDDANLLPEV
jgi:hypothetical protein